MWQPSFWSFFFFIINNRYLYLTVLETEVQDQGAGRFYLVRTCFLIHGLHLFPVSSHGGKSSFWSLKPGVLGEPWWYLNTHEVWGLQRHRKQWTELILWMQFNRSWWGNLRKRDYFIQGHIRVKEGEIENNHTSLLCVIAGIKSCISKMSALFQSTRFWKRNRSRGLNFSWNASQCAII